MKLLCVKDLFSCVTGCIYDGYRAVVNPRFVAWKVWIVKPNTFSTVIERHGCPQFVEIPVNYTDKDLFKIALQQGVTITR